MKDEEKNLIKNLFHRLKNTELNSFERDNSADELIQKLVKQQPFSSYYMVQTILIQETAINKMNSKIEELKKRIEILKTKESNKKPSFLSNFFKNRPDSQKLSHDNNIWKHNDSHLQSQTSNPVTQSSPIITANRNSGFLSNALQTATGVAGGMILGNMLMNVFNHANPEEEVFDTIKNNNTSLQHHDNNDIPDNINHDNLVSYEQTQQEFNPNTSNLDTVNNDVETTDYEEMNHDDENFL
ncbi:hypothetical protein ATN01_00910 [Buchnera aphidicola (Diuraphis noxia)]|uniref:DUF2076 domain-containing protein n=1 Tax=Buchnera aphidicola subsp. Diuraphis noxia TaxID=118101 RepID=A0A1B2H859_BUCDN|nr:DUF2076 domain-containing protein [Buchnera aphidicola]ANZ22411.1 hypothetical protein ATN01_00910 [Buchnera aphidicola (Diuraphis noxia)]